MVRKQGNGKFCGGFHCRMIGELGDRGRVFSEPLIKIPAVVDHNGGAHATVIRATELGANDRVGTWAVGGEGENRWLARNYVLLNAELGDPKGMDDIVSLHPQLHLLTFRNMQFSRSDIAGGIVENEGELEGSYIHSQISTFA